MQHNDQEYRLIYSLFPDFDSASLVAKMLVEEKLVACVNCTPSINSFFRWEGEIKHCLEVMLIAKTHRDLANQVFERISEEHPYSTPCVLSIPIDKLEDKFATWMNDNLVPCPVE